MYFVTITEMLELSGYNVIVILNIFVKFIVFDMLVNIFFHKKFIKIGLLMLEENLLVVF